MFDSHLHDTLLAEDDSALAPDVLDRFFAPVASDALSQLTGEYEALKKRIVEVHSLVTEERVSGVLRYFFSGNARDQYGRYTGVRHENAFEEIFSLEGAISDLTATYWQRALDLTGLMDLMPQARRTEWHTMLNAWREPGYKRGVSPEMDMAEFNEANLRATVDSLMARRPAFLAERVDGVFRALSRTHVTNSPCGFGKRLITAGVFNEWGSADWSMEGVFHDLRVIIALFMGRDEPSRSTTSSILKTARASTGEWIECDGGSFRVRAYMVGTGHVEVHPEMAYRLNGVLAYLYPQAIPEASRRPPRRTKGTGFKNRPLFERPISNAVLSLIAKMEPHFVLRPASSGFRQHDRMVVRNTLAHYRTGETSKHLLAEVARVLSALGGVMMNCSTHKHLIYWKFDYNPEPVIAEVIARGYLPDQKSHQYYPTPEPLAQRLVEWAAITASDTILEPSAGQGGIAALLPADQTLCVEVSPLHCMILREKGLTTVEADFLGWETSDRYSAVLMNPPFSERRWQAHVEKAASLVAPGGRLLGILPATARGNLESLLPEFCVQYSEVFAGAFDGTSASVVIFRATA